MMRPVEVRAPRGARELQIDWEDGQTTTYRHIVLRGFCPCAHCQGHQGAIRWVEGTAEGPGLELSDIEQVGNYALRLTWGDGHNTGIYAFRYLRELGELSGASDETIQSSRFPR